jgi:hypothetical protein
VIPICAGVARGGAKIFYAKLPEELQLFADALLIKSVRPAYEEVVVHSATIGASSHEVASLNSQLRDHLETALIQGHRHLWGTPERGRPPASTNEQIAQARADRADFVPARSRCHRRLARPWRGGQTQNTGEVARMLFPKRKERAGAQVAFSTALRAYGMTYGQLLRLSEEV